MKEKKTDLRSGIGERFPFQPSLFIAALSVVMSIILEILSRRSFGSAFTFIFTKPHLFLFNASLVAATLSIAMIFRKKVFALTLATVLWLGFGIANCVLLGFRTASPLTSVDLQLGMEAILMMDAYFEIWQIILIFALAVAAIAFLVFLALRSPVYRKDGAKGYLRACAFCIFFALYWCLLTPILGIIPKKIERPVYDAYLNNGFPYCFCVTFIDIGMSQPKDYTVEEVSKIVSEVKEQSNETETEKPQNAENPKYLEYFIESARENAYITTPDGYTNEAVQDILNALYEKVAHESLDHPNVIFLQLESFFDPTTIKGLTFSKDPIPNFRKLCEEYTSGELYVPTVAGGTVNTEFEILTGCSLDFFGAGEFPYYSILREAPCESLATELRSLGYTATGVHNYTGSFYYRNTVYDNLGFNRFVSREYMEGYDTTTTGWAKDAILKDVILDALDMSDGSDFVYGVTMQTHGRYIELPESMQPVVTVEGYENEHDKLVMEYFLAQLYESDAFVGDLIAALSERDEDTVLVCFGDHLPGLNFTEEDLTTENIYASRYAIWSNMDLPKRDRDLEAYQLGAYALSQAGIKGRYMTLFHQTQMDDDDYLRNLEILEYDMLYGEGHIFEGSERIKTGEMEFGLHPIEIKDAFVKYGNLFIDGLNFTASSKVKLDSNTHDDTIFVNESLLIVADLIPEDGTALSIAQYSDEGVLLSESEAFPCEGIAPYNYNA